MDIKAVEQQLKQIVKHEIIKFMNNKYKDELQFPIGSANMAVKILESEFEYEVSDSETDIRSITVNLENNNGECLTICADGYYGYFTIYKGDE